MLDVYIDEDIVWSTLRDVAVIKLTGEELTSLPEHSGKTYKVTQYAEDHHAKVIQLNGHSGIESIDILGYNIRASDGSFVWLDGPLTEAFRIAQTEPVILIIDELLRIKSRELNIFISSLTPNASNQFVLNTSRVIDIVDGIGNIQRSNHIQPSNRITLSQHRHGRSP